MGLGAMPITLLPGVGAILLAGALATSGAISDTSAPVAACFAVFLVGLVLFLVTPLWWGPRWYREMKPWNEDPDLSDPGTALVVAGEKARWHYATGADRSRSPARFGPALKCWRGSWIAGRETDRPAHALTHAGAVEGHLSLHAEAVLFVASRSEDLLCDHPTVLAVQGSEIRDVRVVPRGAGPDGRRRPASGPRSAFARLVIDSEHGPLLFEVVRASRKARQIREQLGLGARVASPR